MMAMLDNEEETLFEKLYNENVQNAFAVAMSILHNEHDALEAVSEAFLKAAQNFKKISEIPADNQAAYIVIIVRSTSLDILKQKQRHKRNQQPTEAIEETAAPLPESDESLDFKMAADRLDQTDKDILYLKYIIGFTSRETGKQLGLSAANVRKRAERAKEEIKEFLEKGGKYYD